MQLSSFDYRTEKTSTPPLTDKSLVDILAGDERSRVVYDTEGFLGSNKTFGINYGGDGKKGFIHQEIEYVIDSNNRVLRVSQPYKPKANLFFDADKRDSFATYKVEFASIDEVLAEFVRCGYEVLRE